MRLWALCGAVLLVVTCMCCCALFCPRGKAFGVTVICDVLENPQVVSVARSQSMRYCITLYLGFHRLFYQ